MSVASIRVVGTHTYYFMRLLGLVLRWRLTESAIIRIFAKI